MINFDHQENEQTGPRTNQPEISLEAKMIKLQLPYFGHILRR